MSRSRHNVKRAEWNATALQFVCTQDKPNCGHASPQDVTWNKMVTESFEDYFWISTRSSHKGAVCRNPHHSSNWFYCITRHRGYKHTFCQNVVTKKHRFSLYFLKNIKCWSVGVLRIYEVYSISCKSVYRWVTKYCCFMSDVSPRPNCFFRRNQSHIGIIHNTSMLVSPVIWKSHIWRPTAIHVSLNLQAQFYINTVSDHDMCIEWTNEWMKSYVEIIHLSVYPHIRFSSRTSWYIFINFLWKLYHWKPPLILKS
jgi:hypothetical protein